MRIVTYCILVFLISCTKGKVPEDIIKPEKMEVVFWDVIRADVLITDYTKKDSTVSPLFQNIALQKKIFHAHGVTKEQFYKSFDYYAEHPGMMTTLLDSVIANSAPKNSPAPKKALNL